MVDTFQPRIPSNKFISTEKKMEIEGKRDRRPVVPRRHLASLLSVIKAGYQKFMEGWGMLSDIKSNFITHSEGTGHSNTLCLSACLVTLLLSYLIRASNPHITL